MLEVAALDVFYGKQQVLRGLNLRVGQGEVVALIGPNAAGKSTTLRVLAGLKKPATGNIALAGRNIGALSTAQRVAGGLVLVPEGRQIFARFTVEDNLLMGAYARRDRDSSRGDLERVFAMFPRLRERREQRAGSMSGGEQQMLAIGRGLMAKPSLMLLDEPTLGLAPIIIDELSNTIHNLATNGITILLAEQNAAMALSCAHRAYVLESGRIVLDGEAAALANAPEVKQMYLGS
ncbi:MAG: ABC transporter ATP-binding protein [Methylobacteriaceae bacterium]|nr:ABC transporter ATP-binding protein [Methylobacteriaceae bacterium]